MDEQPEPDSKDWTWVLREQCPECGFDSKAPARDDLHSLAADLGDRWVAALRAATDPRRRPAPSVWSVLEYGCHVRDVYGLGSFRVGLMMAHDDPTFANWDQDQAAIEEDYAGQDPAVVTVALGRSADEFAAIVRDVPNGSWERPGLRGNGSRFTVESFTRYVLHDIVHHLTDVTGRRWA